MADLPLRLALTSVLRASVDTAGDRHGLLVAMHPARPRVPAPRRPPDEHAGPSAAGPDAGRLVLAAVHPLHPQFPPDGDDPSAA